jgi:hypothetical protein
MNSLRRKIWVKIASIPYNNTCLYIHIFGQELEEKQEIQKKKIEVIEAITTLTAL